MWNKPFVEIRVEEFTRGTLPKYMEHHKALALPLLEQRIGRPMAYYMTLTGRINCVTQLWGYDSVAEFHAARHAVESAPQWADYMRATEGVIRFQNTRLTERVVFPGLDDIAGPSRAKPVIDQRVYHIHHNHMSTFLRTTEQFCLKVMLRHIGAPLGYYRTIVGNQNEITHMWGFDGMGDMETRRDARNADPEWKNYLDASDGIYERQQTQTLRRLKVFADD